MRSNQGHHQKEKKYLKEYQQSIKRFLVLVVSIVLSFSVYANPEGGQVVAGSATIEQAPNSTVINQATDKAIINWNSFNIAPNEATHFQQPSSSSVTLNRINPGQGASQIFGQLTANGQIILVNQAGIYFASGAYVNVGGIVASTSDIANDRFLAGKYIFDQPSVYGGTVINRGTIIASQHGLVALIGTNVSNEGVIRASLGKVALASGNKFTVDLSGDQLINFVVVDEAANRDGVSSADGSTLNDAVSNSGKIIANGGSILLTAKSAERVLDNVINMKGVAVANSVSARKGSIILSAGDGRVKVSGKMIAVGKKSGETGGAVDVLGYQVLLTDTAKINVSGEAGGGKVMVWGDLSAQFYGQILAQGGMQGGNGGWVETSGKYYLDINGGLVNTLAPYGETGTWLLDPTNIYIATDQASATAAGMSGTNTSASTGPTTFAASGSVQDSLLTVSTLQTALGSSDVIVTTTNASGTGIGNITVVDPVSWSSVRTLTLTAANNILINAAITTGTGSTLILNPTGTLSQTAAIGGGGGLTVQSGTVDLSQANTYSGATTISGGTLRLSSVNALGSTSGTTMTGGTIDVAFSSGTLANTNSISLPTAATGIESISFSGTNATLANNIVLRGTNLIGGTGTGTLSGVISETSASLRKVNSGTITLTGNNTYASTVTVVAGTLDIGASTALANANSVTVSNGAALNFSFNSATLGNTNNILLNGTGISNNGALTFTGNNVTLANPFTLQSNSTINTNSNTASLSSTMSGSGISLTKIGSGTLNFTGSAKIYSGATLVNAGTLNLSGSSSVSSIGTSGITVASGAALNIGFSSATMSNTRPITLNGTGISNGGALTFSGSSAILSNNLVLQSDSTISNSNTTTLNGIISGSGSLTKMGNGTLNVGGNNTYSGATNVNAGTFNLTTLNGLGSTSSTTVASGAALALGFSSATLANSNTINLSGTGVGGAGALTFAGTGITLNNNIVLQADSTIAIGGSNTTTLNGIISGNFGITKTSGSGTITLGGVNTYSGATTLGGGTLIISADSGLGTAPGVATPSSLVMNGATLQTTGTFALNANRGIALSGSNTFSTNSSTALTYNGVITGSGTLTKAGTGTLSLGGANTYTGNVTVSAGTLQQTAANIFASAGLLTANGTFDLNGFDSTFAGISGSGSITLGSGTLTSAGAGTFSGAMSGSGGFIKSSSSTQTLNGNNTYSGTTAINAGTLTIFNSNGLGNSSGITVANGATLSVGLNSATLTNTGDIHVSGTGVGGGGALTFTGTSATLNNNIILDGDTLVTGTGAALLYGVISGASGLTTNGSGISGIIYLGGNNTYSGATIASGRLYLGSANALGNTSSTTINSGAGLTLFFSDATLANTNPIYSSGGLGFNGNNATITNNIVMQAATILSGTGSGTISGVISGANNLTKFSSGSVTLSGANTYSGTTSVTGGTLSIGATTGLGNTTGTTVSNGAALDFSFNSGTLSNTNNININGTGISSAGALTFTGSNARVDNAVVLQSNSSIGGTGSGILGGVISGAFNLTKVGSGTIGLANTNTYSGTTSITTGTLSLSAVGALGSTTSTTVSGGAALELAFNNGTLSNTNAINLNGTGISAAGALVLTGTGNTLSNNIALQADSSLGGAGSATLSGVISGSNALTKVGVSTITLSGVNTYSGATTINAGTLSIAADSGLGAAPGSPTAGQLTFGGGTLQTTASFTLDANRGIALGTGDGTISTDSSTTLTYNGIMAGGNAFTKAGTGTLILGGNNAYSGATNINAGTLAVATNNALGTNAAGTTLASGATLDLQNVTYSTTEAIINNGGTIAASTGTSSFAGGITLGVNSIFDVGGTQLTLSGVINDGASTFGITKNGTGRLILSNANTYDGANTISAGILEANNNAAIGTGSVTVGSGGTLQIDNGISLSNVISSLSGTGSAGQGALYGSGSGTSTLSGNITLGAETTIGAATGNTLALTGSTLDNGGFLATFDANTGNINVSNIISGTGGLTKSGSGTLTLSGVNTYDGATTINAGTLSIAADSGLGTAPGSPTAGHLTFGGGILQTTASFTLDANRGIALGTGGGTLSTDPATILTYNGIMAGSSAFTKLGTGTLILGGNNTYSGATNINAGTLAITVNNALGTNAAGTTIASGTTLDFRNVTYSTTEGITNNGGTIATSTGTSSFAGGVTLGASSIFNVGGTQLTMSGVIDDGASTFGITKNGTGRLILSNANTYDGTNTISAGVVEANNNTALGTGAVSVASNSTLQIDNGISLSNVISSLSGTGSAGQGALYGSGSGTSTLSGNITLGAAATMGSATSNTLALTGSTFTNGGFLSTFDANTGNITVSNAISGTSGLTKTGSGTLTLSGVNTYGGATTINAGTLSIAADSGLGTAPGSPTAGQLTFGGGILQTTASFTLDANRGIALGTGGGTLSTDPATILTYNGIMAGSNAFTKLGTGTLILGGNNTYSGATNINAGTLAITVNNALGTNAAGTTIASGTTLDFRNVTYSTTEGITNNGGTIATSTGTSSFAGGITLGASSIFNVSGTQLTLSGVIDDGASTFGITKNGTGRLILSNANTYDGTNTISAGVVEASSSDALGTGAISVASGSTLQIDSGATLSNTISSLSGTGSAGQGALYGSGSGTSTLSGNITLGAAATIGAAAGNTLALTGSTFTNGGFLSTFDAHTGNITVSNAISGTGGLTKIGSGTLTLSGNSNYSGATSINAGTLAVTANNALGSNAAGTTIASGATLDLQNVTYSTTEGITNNGGTIATSTGTSSFAGDVTLGASSIFDVSGTQLMLSGVITDDASTFGITKNGTGRLILSGVNTYDGTTTISAGVLEANNNAVLGTGSVSVASNSTLQIDSGISLSNVISSLSGTGSAGQGALYGSGSGTSTLSGNITLGTAATIGAATGNTLALTGSTFTNGGFLTTFDANTGNMTVANAINGAGGVIKTGSGTLTLSGNSNYSGATSINAGTLSLGVSSAVNNTSSLTVANGAALNIGFSNGTLGYASTINLNGSGISNQGALTLSGANDTINNAIALQSSSTIGGTGTGTMVLGGAITGTNTDLTINLPNAGLSLPVITLTTSGMLTAVANGAITLNGSLNANSAGSNSIILSGTSFNNPGGYSLNTGSGRFLVWSGNPSNDNTGGLVNNFKQYNATYDSTMVQGAGNGFLYSIAPVITPALIGTVSKTYTGTTDATLVPANYTFSGNIDGDTVTLNDPVNGTYSSPDPGTNIPVSVVGIAIASAMNGSVTVYGYQIIPTASAPIGTITSVPTTTSAEASVEKSVIVTAITPYNATTSYALASPGAILTPNSNTVSEGYIDLTGNQINIPGSNGQSLISVLNNTSDIGLGNVFIEGVGIKLSSPTTESEERH